MKPQYVQSGIFLILLLFICGPASAYYLTIDAPAQVKVGEPITVNVSTNTPPPDKIDVVLSHSINVPVEIDRQSVLITEKGDSTFNVTFKTDGLEKGNYKVEGLSQSKRDFSAGSRSLRVIKIVDRSDLISITSPTWQEFEKNLLIEAKISGYTDNAIQMEVLKENKTVFGPESIPVSGGKVSYELPISEPGPYDVSFTDYDGYIGKYSIMVEEKDKKYQSTQTPEPTEPELSSSVTELSTPKVSETTEPEQTPEINTDEEPVATGQSKISGITAEAEVSRDSPAFFIIKTNKTPINIQSSDNADWVFEYKTSPGGASVKVNEEIGNEPETVTITESVSDIYLKVYPYSYKASETVTITADTASSIGLSDEAAKAFGVPPRYGTNGGEDQKASTPLPVGIVLISIIASVAVYTKRKN